MKFDVSGLWGQGKDEDRDRRVLRKAEGGRIEEVQVGGVQAEQQARGDLSFFDQLRNEM